MEPADVPLAVDGNCIVVPDGGALPQRCIRCGGPAGGRPLKFAFTWNPHGLGMGSLTGVPALLTNRRGRVWAFYCRRHRPRVWRNCLVLAAVSAASFAVAAYDVKIGSTDLGFAGVSVGFVTVVLMLWYVAMPSIFLDCRRIEGGRLWIEPLLDHVKVSFVEAVSSDGGWTGSHVTVLR